MTSQVVVDASVAYKWVWTDGEPGVEHAVALIQAQRAGKLQLIAPANLFVELVNGLRYSGLGQRDVVALVEQIGLLHVELHEPSVLRLRRATELAFRHNLTICDAQYLGLAEEFGCPLVTADRKAFGKIDTPVEIRLL